MLGPLKVAHVASLLSPRTVNVWYKPHSALLYQQWNRSRRRVHTSTADEKDVPFRKQLKDEAKRSRKAHIDDGGDDVASKHRQQANTYGRQRWVLTVGLEIHAQLNTECKLFSTAKTNSDDTPNSNVALFDLAFPGSQPEFQIATLIPAIRAALGLSCNVQQTSRFDRKHYYYQDQPAGYQITQYYQPFATGGHVTVYDFDGIHPEDGKSVRIDIQQVQMEQDTAKSTLQPPSTALLDFNRVGHPLLEIITLPQIHHPQTAAACVKRIQAILQTVNAVSTGMEMGGLRADVNVSVSPAGSTSLGQRTEIKNLSSFKAVEDAIVAERDRQIAVLEEGGTVHGETRGWNLGSTQTKKLRGKEGEVDYRYMPDPDIPPIIIGEDLVTHISSSLPQSPEVTIQSLVKNGLTVKDAKTLASIDDGERLDYYDAVRTLSRERIVSPSSQQQDLDKVVANWVLHELGGLLSSSNLGFSPRLVPAESMVEILSNLGKGRVTGTTAKRLLARVFHGDTRAVNTIIEQGNLQLEPLSRDEYLAIAQNVLDEHPKKVKQIRQEKQYGKIQFFVGRMMRLGEGKIEAGKANDILIELLSLD